MYTASMPVLLSRFRYRGLLSKFEHLTDWALQQAHSETEPKKLVDYVAVILVAAVLDAKIYL